MRPHSARSAGRAKTDVGFALDSVFGRASTLALCALLISACSSAPASTGGASQTAAGPSPGATGGQEAVTLVVWGEPSSTDAMETDPTGVGSYLLTIKKQFEDAHPGVTLKIEDHGWADVLRQNLTNALLAGTQPDIINGEADFKTFAALGALVPIDDVFTDELKSNSIEGATNGGQFDGKQYGLPAYTGVEGFERNCTVVIAAGLDCSEAPKTWDDLLSQAQTITQMGNGKYYGATVVAQPGSSYGTYLYSGLYLAQVGAPGQLPDGTPNFNDPKAVPAYEFLRKLYKFSPPGLAFETDGLKLFTALDKGLTAYGANGNWAVQASPANGCTDCRFSSIPVPAGGQPASMIVGNVIYAALARTKYPDLAKDFILLTQKDDIQALQWKVQGRLPSTRSALTAIRPTVDAATQVFIDELLNNKNLSIPPQWPKNPQVIYQAYNDMLARVMTTEEPIQGLLDQLQATAVDALK
jgi:ABC-type glycerol-3-phosphate transport system substrate-binding protein